MITFQKIVSGKLVVFFRLVLQEIAQVLLVEKSSFIDFTEQ